VATTTAENRIDPKVAKTAVILIVGALAVVFDTTIISVALRTLSVQLHAPISTVQWVSTGYLLALGVAIPLAGWAQVRFGGKRVWMFALAVFLVGSVLCSLAWSAESLILFRVVQGLGGGLMLPLFATLIMQAAAGRALGRTMSLVMLPLLIGPVLGPVIGGVILNWLNWRWLFWVNVPFCVVGFILAWRMLDRDTTNARPRIDIVGWLLLSPSLIAILFGLSNSSQTGGFGRADAIIPLIVGAVLLTMFVLYSLRQAGSALVDIRLLSHRPLASSSALTFLTGAALYGGMVLMPLYWQEVRGMNALHAGLLVAPQGIGALLSRPVGGLSDRIGVRWVAFAGFLIVGLATVPFALASPSTNEWYLMAVLVVRGFGLASVSIPLSAAAYIGLRHDEIPHASIITRVAQQVGGSFGVAVLAVILAAALRNLGPHSGSAATATAFDQAFWWAVGFTGLALALSLILPNAPAEEVASQEPPVNEFDQGAASSTQQSAGAPRDLEPEAGSDDSALRTGAS
jgi:EmrB/QacA subfamily drug resistance transporter